MHINLIHKFSREFDKTTKSQNIDELNDKMQLYFNGKYYGETIIEYLIGIICVHPNYDPFFKVRRPLYTEDKTVTIHGLEIHIYKSFGIDIKLRFEDFIQSGSEDGLKMVANEILTTVKNMKYPAKVKSFDKDKFYQDLNLFFEEEGLV